MTCIRITYNLSIIYSVHDLRVCPTFPHAVHFDGAFFLFCIGSPLLFCSNWSHFRFLGFGKGIRGSKSGRYSDSLSQRPVRQNGWISVNGIALLFSNKLEIRCAQGSPIVLVNVFVQGGKGAYDGLTLQHRSIADIDKRRHPSKQMKKH